MLLKNEQWNDLGDGTSLYPIEERPNIINSNTYLLDEPETLVIIDHGGTEQRAEHIEEVVRERGGSKSKPIVCVLTHCHLDHLAGLEKYSPDFRKRCVAAASSVTRNILADPEDAVITNSRIYGVPPPEVSFDLLFFTGERQTAGSFHVEGTADGEALFHGEKELLRVIAAPGHTPDSLFFRYRDILFTGDVFYALNPGIAGLPGWNALNYRHTLLLLKQILEKVSICCPGHDHARSAEDFEVQLDDLLRKARQYDNVAEMTPERVAFLEEYTEILLNEIKRFFTIMAGRLYRLAHELEDAGETETARELFGTLEFDSIEKLLLQFRSFRFGTDSMDRQSLRMGGLMKGIQTVRKIRKLLESSKYASLFDASLLRRADMLMCDYVNSISGIPFHGERTVFEVNSAVKQFLDTLSGTESAPANGVSGFLLEKFRELNLFHSRTLVLAPFPQPVRAELPKEPFFDSVQHILEKLLLSKTKQISIHVISDGLILTSDSFRTEIGLRILNGYVRRTFAMLDCRIACGPDGIVILFPESDPFRTQEKS